MSPFPKMLVGLAVTVASAWVLHGPLGFGQRLLGKLDAQVQPVMAKQELPSVTASFGRDPMTRDLRFRGQANSFQRQRFVEIIEDQRIRGVRSIGWDPASPPVEEPRR